LLIALSMLTPLTSLRVLDLPSTLVEGAGLDALTALPNLRELDLDSAPIGNDGAARLAKLTQLESLNLRHTDITDPGMVHVGSLGGLERLDLIIDITEKGSRDRPPPQLEDWTSASRDLPSRGWKLSPVSRT
jgi:Leucine-rich repeat (LRR) protein